MNDIANLSGESGPDVPVTLCDRSNIISTNFVKSCQLAHRVSQINGVGLSAMHSTVRGVRS